MFYRSLCAFDESFKGHKILIALKVFAFNTDEGVSGQLARLAELVERESQMRGTLGFESQKNSEKNIVETRDGTKKISGRRKITRPSAEKRRGD